MQNLIVTKDGFTIATDRNMLDIDSIHRFLSGEAYWSLGIPRSTVERSIQNSLCFGVYEGKKQVGFARIISDYSTIAYLGDVYILPGYRGKGLSKWLMETIMAHPDLEGLRRWILLTGDAHNLYRQFGWKEIADPAKWMEIHDKDAYK